MGPAVGQWKERMGGCSKNSLITQEVLALRPHFENQGLWAGTPTPGMGRGGGVGEEHWIAGYRFQAQRWVRARKRVTNRK